MKLFISPFFCLVAVTVFAEMTEDEKLVFRNGAIGRYVYRVVDDEGDPVGNATAHVCFSSYGRPQDKADWLVLTDTNGMFTAEHRFNEKFSVGIDKEGYYHTHDEINYFSMIKRPIKDGKWQPFGEVRTVVLKKIKNPIRLCDPNAACRHKYPVNGGWVGFDLENCDWVPPLGDGRCSDVLVRYVRENRADGYFKTLEVAFTNNAYAGAYLMAKDSYSEMDSVYGANTNANYVGYMRYEFERNAKGNHVISELGVGEYLVFRTRTKVDSDGKLISAHYGRIMGEWQYIEKGGMSFGPVYFNPYPNDTNLEDAETARLSRLWYKQRLEFERQRKAKVK